jgi:Fe-Mn family superoxide dismutase
LFYHHDKHHAKYISTTNALIKGTEYEHLKDLESIMIKSHDSNKALFNNAAQSWNHDFYWKCMRPNKADTNAPSGKLLKAIEDSFGSLDEFKKQVCII